MDGNLLAHAGHIQRAHLVDGEGALSAHVEREGGKDAHAQQGYSDQAGDEEPGGLVLHPAPPS